MIDLSFMGSAGILHGQDLTLQADYSWEVLVVKEILEDTSRNIGIESILDSSARLPFSRTEKLHFGISEFPFWLQSTIRNESTEPELVLVFGQPAYDRIDLWLTDEMGLVLQEFHHDYSIPGRNL